MVYASPNTTTRVQKALNLDQTAIPPDAQQTLCILICIEKTKAVRFPFYNQPSQVYLP
jgi:hypothetical protein